MAELKADYYVAPDGNDLAPGTVELPFATVGRAQEAVRKRVAAGLDRDVRVLFRGGTYEQARMLAFGPEDAGDERHSITYASFPGERVVWSGGRRITGWKRGAGEIWTVELPAVKAGEWYFRQLFVDGKRAIRARTPNAGEWWKLVPQPGLTDDNHATLTVGVDHPIQSWKNVEDVEVTWLYNNDGTRRRLGSVDVASNTLTLPPPHRWPHDMSFEYNLSLPKGAYSCYLENALEMLDEPGEWYLDRKSGVLSYWPRAGEVLARAEVVAPVVQNTLLAVQGTRERPVRNLHFQGITVADVDWALPAYGWTGMFGCLQVEELDDAERSRRFYWIDAAVSMAHARSCSYTDGGIVRAGGIGLAMQTGCSRNVVEGNEIASLGGGGIVAGAIRNRDTWQWADPIAADDQQGYRIANNHIHDGGLDYFGAVGIFTAAIQDAVIEHNLVHDMAYAGIVFMGEEVLQQPFTKNNILAHNHVHHCCRVAVDGGGIYLSCPQGGWGAQIYGNVIHDIHRNPYDSNQLGPWSAPGMYFDGLFPTFGCSGYDIQDTVVYHVDTRPLFLHQTSKEGNTWTDNQFVVLGELPAEYIEAVQEVAGLEPGYRRSLLHAEPVPCRHYQLLGPSRSGAAWSVQQWDLETAARGMVLACRRPASNEENKRARLRGLDAEAEYVLKAWMTFPDPMAPDLISICMGATISVPGAVAGKPVTGRQLMEDGIEIKLGHRPGRAWVAYRRVDA